MRFGKLREEIRKNHRTLRDFAKVADMDYVSLSRRLNGQQEFRRNEIERICGLLDIPGTRIWEYFFYN